MWSVGQRLSKLGLYQADPGVLEAVMKTVKLTVASQPTSGSRARNARRSSMRWTAQRPLSRVSSWAVELQLGRVDGNAASAQQLAGLQHELEAAGAAEVLDDTAGQGDVEFA